MIINHTQPAPELYALLNPMPYETVVQMEQDLAEDSRRVGYTVMGGHQFNFVKSCGAPFQVCHE